jgi:hypothetical protein
VKTTRFIALVVMALVLLPACSILSGEAGKTQEAMADALAYEGPRPQSVECEKNGDVKLRGNGADVYDCRVEYAAAQTESYCAGWVGGGLSIEQGFCRGNRITE